MGVLECRIEVPRCTDEEWCYCTPLSWFLSGVNLAGYILSRSTLTSLFTRSSAAILRLIVSLLPPKLPTHARLPTNDSGSRYTRVRERRSSPPRSSCICCADDRALKQYCCVHRMRIHTSWRELGPRDRELLQHQISGREMKATSYGFS